jgi:hypothetical protein
MGNRQTYESERRKDVGKTSQEIQLRDIERSRHLTNKNGARRMEETDKSHVSSGEGDLKKCGVCGRENLNDVSYLYVNASELPAVQIQTRIGNMLFKNGVDDCIEEGDTIMRKVGVCGKCLQKLQSKETLLNSSIPNCDEDYKIRLVVSPC